MDYNEEAHGRIAFVDFGIAQRERRKISAGHPSHLESPMEPANDPRDQAGHLGSDMTGANIQEIR
jgi:hypothetical protein